MSGKLFGIFGKIMYLHINANKITAAAKKLRSSGI
jgi:hypothetical protein